MFTDSQMEAACRLAEQRYSVWKWCDKSQTITWFSGPTISFRDELRSILEHVKHGGMPSMNSLALIIASTRKNWTSRPSNSQILASYRVNCSEFNADRSEPGIWLELVMKRLDQISKLSWNHQTTLSLIEAVFEQSSLRSSPEVANAAIRILQSGTSEFNELILPHRYSETVHDIGPAAELNHLAELLEDFDPASVQLRAQTNLDELPAEAEIELPRNLKVRQLIKVLETDEEFGGLARIASRLMAALTLPRSMSEPDELPLGGVSDISNRGSLDRLLLSELAYDDFSLAVRVAMNEALYLRRESPPKTPPQQRFVLIDSGIRSWGVPRVLQTAIGLAIEATSDISTETCSFRACGKGVADIDFTTRDGIIEHLSVLESELHPGDAISAFEERIARRDTSTTPVLVMTEEAFDDDEFSRQLRAADPWPVHAATVSREGRFRLTECSEHGNRTLSEAQIELDDLFDEPEKSRPSLVDDDTVTDLPAFVRMFSPPLRFSHGVTWASTWMIGSDRALSITKDKRLMLWDAVNRGAIELDPNVESRDVHWTSNSDDPDKCVAIVGRTAGDSALLLSIDLASKSVIKNRMRMLENPRKIATDHRAIFFLVRGRIYAYSLSDGRLLSILDERVHHKFERFVTMDDNWYAISFNGSSIELELVVSAEKASEIQLVALFETPGIDGAKGITADGKIYSTANDTLTQIDGLESTVDGISWMSPAVLQRIRPGIGAGSLKSFLNFLGREPHHVPSKSRPARFDEASFLRARCQRLIHQRPIRKRLTAVGVNARGTIYFRRPNGAIVLLHLTADRKQLCMTNSRNTKRQRSEVAFSRANTESRFGFELRLATLKHGQRIWLDTRGLLHLSPADSTLPELTIVLDQHRMGGWCSDGRTWGHGYYLLDEPTSSAAEIYDSVIKPFAARLS